MRTIAQGKLSERDIAGATEAARCVVETHHAVAAELRVGIELGAVDLFIAETLSRLRAKSCFLRYRASRLPPFPSHACLSVNDCVVHGTAATLGRPLQHGDLLKIDIGSIKNGWIGDAAWTYSIGEPTEEVARLMACGKECLRRGIETLTPGSRLIEWAKAVQQHAEDECGFYLVRGLGGHGYGKRLHESPWVSNTVPAYPSEWPDGQMDVSPGMLLAVEPMIAIGSPHTASKPKEWPMLSADGSMTVHYEADVLVTDAGPVDLTAELPSVEDIILR